MARLIGLYLVSYQYGYLYLKSYSFETLQSVAINVNILDGLHNSRYVMFGVINDSRNSLLSIRRQAIFWSNTDLLLIWTLLTNYSEIWIKTLQCSCTKINLTNFVLFGLQPKISFLLVTFGKTPRL